MRISSNSFYGKEVKSMKEFIATSNRQLGECIRLLSSYGLNGRFSTTFNKKGRIVFHIWVDIDDTLYDELKKRYACMIS